MRILYITISDELEIIVHNDNEYFDVRKPIFLGYVGEDAATQLNVTFDDEFIGSTYYLYWDGVSSAVQTDLTLEYPVPLTYMTKGIHKLVIEIHGTGVSKTPPIYLEVK